MDTYHKKVLVKLYDCAALVRLALADMCRKNGFDYEGNVQFIASVDDVGRPMIRLELQEKNELNKD